MILVDTSVLVEYLRSGDVRWRRAFETHLPAVCGVVRAAGWHCRADWRFALARVRDCDGVALARGQCEAGPIHYHRKTIQHCCEPRDHNEECWRVNAHLRTGRGPVAHRRCLANRPAAATIRTCARQRRASARRCTGRQATGVTRPYYHNLRADIDDEIREADAEYVRATHL